MTVHAPKTFSTDDTFWCGLAYLGALLVVPPLAVYWLKREESAVLRFHTQQALCVGVGWLLLLGGFRLVASIGPLAPLVGLLEILTVLVVLGFWLFLTLQAYRGEDVVLPFIGEIILVSGMGRFR
jgi:uncharacterized membrane protein